MPIIGDKTYNYANILNIQINHLFNTNKTKQTRFPKNIDMTKYQSLGPRKAPSEFILPINKF